MLVIKRNKKLEKALEIACELLNGGVIYGIDADTLWSKVMESEGYVSSWNIKDFILDNIDRFSDDDEERNEAIKQGLLEYWRMGKDEGPIGYCTAEEVIEVIKEWVKDGR